MKLAELLGRRPITAKKAWNESRFNKRVESIDSIVRDKINLVDGFIEMKTKSSQFETSVIVTVPAYQNDVWEAVEKHYRECGFNVVHIKNYPSLEGEEYLIISWHDGGIKEEA